MKWYSVVAPISCMISIALSFIVILSRCSCSAISHGLEMLFLISSYDQSCQGEKSRTLPSSLLKEISWEMVPYARIGRISLKHSGSVTKPLRVSRNTSVFF